MSPAKCVCNKAGSLYPCPIHGNQSLGFLLILDLANSVPKTPEQLLFWLRGMIEGIPTAEPSPTQWLKIKDAVMGVDLVKKGTDHAS